MKKVTAEKTLEQAKTKINEAIGKLKESNSLIASDITSNESEIIQISEQIENLSNKRAELKEKNKLNVEKIETNEATITSLEQHI